jgi:hypothetical protein
VLKKLQEGIRGLSGVPEENDVLRKSGAAERSVVKERFNWGQTKLSLLLSME